MNRTILTAVALAAVTLLVSAAQAEERRREYVGYAYAPDSDDLYYTEHHVETLDENGRPTTHVVTYRDPDGEVLANKTIDYRRNRLFPDFRMEDVRDGYLEGGETVAAGYRLYTRKTAEDEIREEIVRVPGSFVADAGFNQFVVEEWDRLMTGRPIEIQFAAPPQLDHFRFRAGLVDRKTFLGRQAGVLRIEIGSALLRFFVDPIVLTYDLETRELLEFAGMANVNDPTGKSYVARIEFPHGQKPPPQKTAAATPAR